MNDWQELAARAIRREQRPNPLERMKIREDSPVGADFIRGYNSAIADVIALQGPTLRSAERAERAAMERAARTDDADWTPSIDADYPR